MASALRYQFTADTCKPVAGATMPEFKQAGSSLTVSSYSFDAGTTERVQVCIPQLSTYGSGDWILKVKWFADNATTNSVAWEVAVAAITPGTDTTDVEAKTFATAVVGGASNASGSSQAEVTATVTLTSSQINSAATGDTVWIRVSRKFDDAGDTMANDAQMIGFALEYSDT